MSIDSITYLLEVYWPYAAAAALIGLGAGWFSYTPTKTAAELPPAVPPSES